MNADLLERLEREHRDVEALFTELAEASDESTQRRLVDELTDALTAHMETEEAEVYPELARIEGELASEAATEHGLARDGLAKLDGLVGQPGFGAAVAMVQAGVAHHVKDEETEAFPKLRAHLGIAEKTMTKEELYEAAKEAGVEGRSSMTKQELADALE